RLVHAEAHRVQPESRMGVGGYSQFDTEILGELAMQLVKVEARRMRVEFERYAALSGPFDDTLDIERVGRTLAQQTAGGVGENAEIFVVHGAQNALGLFPG